jgi:hypothetical protein
MKLLDEMKRAEEEKKRKEEVRLIRIVLSEPCFTWWGVWLAGWCRI